MAVVSLQALNVHVKNRTAKQLLDETELRIMVSVCVELCANAIADRSLKKASVLFKSLPAFGSEWLLRLLIRETRDVCPSWGVFPSER